MHSSDKLDYQKCEDIASNPKNLFGGDIRAFKVHLTTYTQWEHRSGEVPELVLYEVDGEEEDGKPIYQLFVLAASWSNVPSRRNKLKYLMSFRPNGSVRYAADPFGTYTELLSRVGPLDIKGGYTGKFLNYEERSLFGPINEDIFVPAEYMQIWSDVHRGKLPASILEDWLQDNGYK